MAALFKVNEYSTGFEVEHIPTGKTHWMGDGVDLTFTRDDNPWEGDLTVGMYGFREGWEQTLNNNENKTLEEYFPELVETGVDK